MTLDRYSELRKAGIALECAAGALNATAHRCEAKQSTADDFDQALSAYQFARDTFRLTLAETSCESVEAIERWLAL